MTSMEPEPMWQVGRCFIGRACQLATCDLTSYALDIGHFLNLLGGLQRDVPHLRLNARKETPSTAPII